MCGSRSMRRRGGGAFTNGKSPPLIKNFVFFDVGRNFITPCMDDFNGL